jgi:hypothetical protein
MATVSMERELVQPPVRRFGNWIIDGRSDVLFLIGPVVFGYLFLVLNIQFGVSSFLLWWLWLVTVDGPHLFATVSRTYLDRREWVDRGRLLLGSLLWIGLGPFALMVDADWETNLASSSLVLFQMTWAYFHVVRQHYGLFCLYQRKNNEPSGAHNRGDYWFFNIAMFGPFVVWLLRYPPVRGAMDISKVPRIEQNLTMLIEVFVSASVMCFVSTVVVSGTRSGNYNVPKALLFLSYFSLHALVAFWLPSPYVFDTLLLFAVFSYPHNIQYIAIVWHYNKNRLANARGDAGPAAFISRSLQRFLLIATVCGISYHCVAWYFEGLRTPLVPVVSSLAGMPLYGHSVGLYVRMIVLGIALNHYYLDQKIWRINRDPKVARRLGVEPSR